MYPRILRLYKILFLVAFHYRCQNVAHEFYIAKTLSCISRPRGHVKMKPMAEQSSPTTEIKDEINGGGYKQGSIRHFKNSFYEDNIPKEDSLSLSADIVS